MYAFSSMLECGCCGAILSRRSWHCRSDYRKVVWHCTISIKKGKKYCNHSKGLEEAAIMGAFLEVYRQLYHSNSTIADAFLETIESELSDETLQKEFKKSHGRYLLFIKKEEKLNVEITLKSELNVKQRLHEF